MSATQSKRNIKWVEGLRGITSVLVIATHLARALDFWLFWPSDKKGVPPRWLQLPFLRIPWQGRIGVPVFAFLTGFVCAYKPLTLAYQKKNIPASLKSIARSAFRRPPRLMFPALIATVFSFILSCLGAYTASNHCDSFWVRFDAPEPLPFQMNVRRLFKSLLTTWTNTENKFDRHQWAMRPLLVGAFQVYIVLAATIGMRFRYRIVVHVLLITYWLMNVANLTETFGANLALGTLLAELSQHRPTQNFISSHQRILSYIVAPILLLIGGYIGSYPHEHEDWMPWSNNLHKWLSDPAGDQSRGSILVPLGANTGRRATSFFVQCVAVSIFLSFSLQRMLSNRFLLWLGHHSFAVYLTHGTLLRTVGIWIVYGISGQPWEPAGLNEDGSQMEQMWLKPKSRMHKQVAIVVFTLVTYLAAWAWMKWVDTACARATMWLEKKVFDDEEEESRAGLAEKGYSSVNGNGSATRPTDSERGPPPP
ncbi:acyltransferase 3 [Podospora appendiculata]|uniref:Acyltransferase 3 n=1 Tax=Podospora appendiculata TaxID=314037 RepID=A0AAE0WY75_9PEZI|nr:acyltransferase 3 [Podospora appendiculata]KAK3680654.1 acyltransferase 3 [Podospora appendiculata]KAK3681598.1 acyltransferase 3 [Podospora appendiculata]